MTLDALLFTLAALGISEAVYLIRKRAHAEAPVCPIGGDCTVVLSSPWSKTFIIPNDALGLIFYVAAACMTALLVIGVGPTSLVRLFLAILVGLGSLMSLFLVYLQWRVIRAWCSWCLFSAMTVWVMGAILLIQRAMTSSI